MSIDDELRQMMAEAIREDDLARMDYERHQQQQQMKHRASSSDLIFKINDNALQYQPAHQPAQQASSTDAAWNAWCVKIVTDHIEAHRNMMIDATAEFVSTREFKLREELKAEIAVLRSELGAKIMRFTELEELRAEWASKKKTSKGHAA